MGLQIRRNSRGLYWGVDVAKGERKLVYKERLRRSLLRSGREERREFWQHNRLLSPETVPGREEHHCLGATLDIKKAVVTESRRTLKNLGKNACRRGREGWECALDSGGFYSEGKNFVFWILNNLL